MRLAFASGGVHSDISEAVSVGIGIEDAWGLTGAVIDGGNVHEVARCGVGAALNRREVKLALLMSKKMEPWPLTLMRAARWYSREARPTASLYWAQLLRAGRARCTPVQSCNRCLHPQQFTLPPSVPATSQRTVKSELPARLMLVLGYDTKKGPVVASIKKGLGAHSHATATGIVVADGALEMSCCGCSQAGVLQKTLGC